jgi:hypothetical protein
MSQTLSQDQALSVLIQAVRIAQSKGAYTLEDAKVIADAVAVFVPAKTEEVTETTETAEAVAEKA